ncbi:hypothetical protein [Sutcliffiella cohnii]|uniref:hypothetical protein n=1 Tax=Sutcliffiella cohnii TaxID=33932 RepID=UPI002E1ACBEB|nr:hypothetical protein [Sutcliffiella cohnii]
MKKKWMLSLFGMGFIAIVVVSTVAHFSKSFTSANNIVSAATFSVDAVGPDGISIGDAQFDLAGVFYPGITNKEVYSFQVRNNDSSVPVEYIVNFLKSGGLFPENHRSPILITLEKLVGENWVEQDYNKPITPNSDVETYRVLVSWLHSGNDINFQGKTGKIDFELIVKQADLK